MSNDPHSCFIDKCINGDVLYEEIDEFVKAWHEGDSKEAIEDYLGMTNQEYSLWVSDPKVLPFIITAHRDNTPILKLLEELESLPLAARASTPEKAMQLMKWLKDQGLQK